MESNRLVSDELYDQLYLLIAEGEWKVGDKLPSENAISREYNTSRVSVRTALHKLQALGYIVTKPGKGSFVASASQPQAGALSPTVIDLSASDYKYMIQLRRALEFTSIRVLCSEGTEEDFGRLREACEALSAADTAKSYADADYSFHYSLILGSHNPVFIQIYDIFRDTIYKYLFEMSGDNLDNNWDNAKNNHRMILDAICSRDAEKAIGIIEGTFEFNYNRLSRYFKD